MVKHNDSDSKGKFQLVLAFAERNILKNAQFYIIVFLVLFAIDLMQRSSMVDTLEAMRKDNLEANNKVIGLTIDGRVIGIEKTKVDAANMQTVVARAIRDSLIVGRRELTKNYTVSNFSSVDDLLNNSDRLKSAFTNYIYMGEPEKLSEEDKQFQAEAAQYFTSYLKYLLMSINDNNLPHFISVTDMNVVQFVPDKNRFTIRLQLPCQTESVGNDGKVIPQQGVNEIYAEGVFDVAKGTHENPFGLKIIPKEMKIVEISPRSDGAYKVTQ